MHKAPNKIVKYIALVGSGEKILGRDHYGHKVDIYVTCIKC